MVAIRLPPLLQSQPTWAISTYSTATLRRVSSSPPPAPPPCTAPRRWRSTSSLRQSPPPSTLPTSNRLVASTLPTPPFSVLTVARLNSPRVTATRQTLQPMPITPTPLLWARLPPTAAPSPRAPSIWATMAALPCRLPVRSPSRARSLPRLATTCPRIRPLCTR